MLLRRLKYPGTTGLIFRRVYDDLKRNHIDKFFEEFPQLFKFYRASDHEVILPSQDGKAPSRIVFAYAETETEVKRKFMGPDYMDIFIDQGEQLTEQELKTIKTSCRWPGTPQHSCKFVIFFNPGGKSIQFFKRVFKDLKFEGKEKKKDFSFIQAYGWDNVEWVRSSLIEDGLTEEDFYSWSDNERFEYFIARSQYGQDLDSLPPAMRVGHLLGSLDVFAGQYFDIWAPEIHVKPENDILVSPWDPKWISIDWGYAHESAVLWWAQGEITKTYREFVKAGMGPTELAYEIVKRCKLEEEKERIDAVYLSPDAFAKRSNTDTFAQQIGKVLRENGLPYPRPADNDRKSGWMLMYEMLKYNKWIISSACPRLIGNIPLFTRDEDGDPEDCVKFKGDDPGDSARYGVKSRFHSMEPPRGVQLHRNLEAVRKRLQGRGLGEINTALHMSHLKFDKEFVANNRPVRRIRNWRAS